MRRILLLLILLAASAAAAANVSLGEIEVRSFLNQPLQAQFSAEGEALADEDVEFRVASEDAYRRAGLQRSAVPADLAVDIQGSGTNRVIRLTTQRPVREPYLGLLLEVRWPAGRLLREYTILLDPPVAFAPQRSAAPVITRAPEPSPRDVASPVARAERPPLAATTYNVRRGDTLSAIVSRLGYTGVTSQQAMLAILDANPRAFIGGNINQLRAGADLRLPEQAEVAAYGRQEALQEVRRQIAEWRERTAPVPPPAIAQATPAPEPLADAPPRVPGAPPSDPSPEADLGSAADSAAATEPPVASDEGVDEAATPAPVPEAAPDDTEVAVMDRLEILAEDEFEPTVAATTGSQVIEEALLSQQVAMSELRDEVSVLRTELAERDERIRVMNAELAQLEERMEAVRSQPAGGLTGSGADGTALHERLLADPLLLLLAATSMLLFLLLLVSLFRPRRSVVAAEAPVAPSVVAPAPRERAVRVPDTGRASPGAGAGTASIAAAAGAAAAGTASAASEERDERAPVSLGSPSRSIDVSDEPKVEDVLADVDLYLAYGMNDQAITALENAIREGRDDPEYRVRLIEAYAASNDGDAVRREAATLRDALGPDQPALLERVAAAEARVPAPEATADGSGEGQSTGAMADSDTGENVLEFDVSEATGQRSDTGATDETGERSEDETDRSPLRFDLGDGPEVSPEERERAVDDTAADELPELTLPDLEPDQPEISQPAASAADSDTSENGMKLSLAEAFVEMGDPEGALALLDEVLPTATDAQRAKVEVIRRQIEGGDG